MTSPEDEAVRLAQTWRPESWGEERGTSRSSSTTGSTNVSEERGMQEEEDDTIEDMTNFLSEEGNMFERSLFDREILRQEAEEEEEEEEEEERERAEEERIVSRFMTRHGWAWESDIDRQLRPV